jgi:hypothetical protein
MFKSTRSKKSLAEVLDHPGLARAVFLAFESGNCDPVFNRFAKFLRDGARYCGGEVLATFGSVERVGVERERAREVGERLAGNHGGVV